MKIPPYLKPGDTIGLVCPASYMAPDQFINCINTLKKWGYNVVEGKTLGSKSIGYLSGTDAERLADLQSMLDDPNINAVMCARGGYGTTRILDDIDWSNFKKNPKWVIGFSDITILHSFMQTNLNIASLHGPMAGAFNDEQPENKYTLSLKDSFEGTPAQYTAEPHQLNRTGKAKAQVVGGNLALLAHAIGTNAEYDTNGKILFIEDVGEHLYTIDRMMQQLKRAGKLEKLKALIVGGFTDCKDTTRPFGQDAYHIIAETIQKYKYPVCFGFPISHGKENVAVVVGKEYELSVDEELASLVG